jgi:hypothetical protein
MEMDVYGTSTKPIIKIGIKKADAWNSIVEEMGPQRNIIEAKMLMSCFETLNVYIRDV